jgi:hypothetical protein
MATLEEHKAQVKIDKPEGTVKVHKNGTDIFIEGDAYNAWVDDVAASRLDKEQNGWIENRIREYPTIADQLDDIYHNGLDAWKVTIKKVKDDNPKPGE